METEILSDEELADLTGYKARAYQRRWLTDRQWVFVESRGSSTRWSDVCPYETGHDFHHHRRRKPSTGGAGMDA